MIGKDLLKSVAVLNNGGVIGFPTETVYGLAANALNDNAVGKIFDLKNRPSSNPLILHVHSLEAALKYTTGFSPTAIKLANTFWPGALTLLLPKRSNISDMVTAGSDLVAIRVPNHPMALSLLNQLNFPLVAPSANPYKRISPTNAKMVYDYFEEQVPYILDGGDCINGIESTIVGFDENIPIIYRQGSISMEAIELVVGRVRQELPQNVVTPGSSKIHYAPLTKMYIIDDILQFVQAHPTSKIGFIGMGDKHIAHPNIEFQTLSDSGNLEEASYNLYKTMYYFDSLELDYIVIKKFPNFGIGISLNDRISRAALPF